MAGEGSPSSRRTRPSATGRYAPAPIRPVAGVGLRQFCRTDVYRGSLDALVSSGIAPAALFPGQPGRPAMEASYRPIGAATAERRWDVPGHLHLRRTASGDYVAIVVVAPAVQRARAEQAAQQRERRRQAAADDHGNRVRPFRRAPDPAAEAARLQRLLDAAGTEDKALFRPGERALCRSAGGWRECHVVAGYGVQRVDGPAGRVDIRIGYLVQVRGRRGPSFAPAGVLRTVDARPQHLVRVR